MKEAVGNSFLVTISIVLLFLIMSLLVASLSYSKAYKAKNKIISVIEKYDGYTANAEADITTDLKQMGYKIVSSKRSCPKPTNEETDLIHDTDIGQYDFCVYSIKSSRGYYYHVITYMHFDVPMVEQYLTFKVEGDSRTVYQNLEG